jgi:hypothetical protein
MQIETWLLGVVGRCKRHQTSQTRHMKSRQYRLSAKQISFKFNISICSYRPKRKIFPKEKLTRGLARLRINHLKDQVNTILARSDIAKCGHLQKNRTERAICLQVNLQIHSMTIGEAGLYLPKYYLVLRHILSRHPILSTKALDHIYKNPTGQAH